MSSNPPPDTLEVDRIAALDDPVVRNLQITNCYHELSQAFAEQIKASANWCTFAVWVSKQAGQTIRKEDIARTLEAVLKTRPLAELAILKLISISKNIGAKQGSEEIQRLILNTLTFAALSRIGDAVGRGNKKVFEEIGREFARFIPICMQDSAFDADKIQNFCNEFRPGLPPDGQKLLSEAFQSYYQSLFEPDIKKRAELLLLANLKIAVHEQTRLQPEILASLNAAIIDTKEFRELLLDAIFPDRGWLTRTRFFFLRLFGRFSHFDEAADSLAEIARHQLRLVLTEHLLTISFPPDVCLRLGHDLIFDFPDSLRELNNFDLLTLLEQIDPTPDNLSEAGAVDWADLADRLHFIADLFRCFQESTNLFESPFTQEQVTMLKAGNIPAGRL